VKPSSNLIKSNNYPGFKINNTPAKTSRLKLNPFLIAYAEGFITVTINCEFNTTIFANKRFNILFIFYKVYKVS